MGQSHIHVLLVEDDPIAAGLFSAQLASDFGTRFEAEVVANLDEALELARTGSFDVAVLDLVLPDVRGLEALKRFRAEAGHLPVVVFTGLDDEELAVSALKEGAQDYLVKGDLTGRLISRSLRYAIERQRLTETLRGLSLLDDLTGHYNRRGLLTLAEQHIKAARRLRRGIAVISAQLRGPRGSSSALIGGPHRQALQRVGEVLRETFRGSDLVARFSENTFLVLATEPDRHGAAAAIRRLERKLQPDPAPEAARFAVDLGLEWVDDDKLTCAEDLVAAYDCGTTHSPNGLWTGGVAVEGGPEH